MVNVSELIEVDFVGRQDKRMRQAARKAEKKRRRERYQKVISRRRLYPGFSLFAGDAPLELVDLVKQAMRRVNFESLPEDVRRFFKYHRCNGRDAARKAFGFHQEPQSNVHYIAETRIALAAGELIIKGISKDALRRYIPYYDIFVIFGQRTLDVRIRSLRRRKTRNGTAYYSPHEPKITTDDGPKLVTFSRHAIDRACKRLIGGCWDDYAGMGDVFGVFHDTYYFETTRLCDGQPAIVLFTPCHEHTVEYSLLDHVMPERPREGVWHWKLAYFPYAISEDIAYAKTCLFPGFSKTPEYDAIHKACRSSSEKGEMLKTSRNLSKENLFIQEKAELIRVFHQAGVCQFKRFEKSVMKVIHHI